MTKEEKKSLKENYLRQKAAFNILKKEYLELPENDPRRDSYEYDLSVLYNEICKIHSSLMENKFKKEYFHNLLEKIFLGNQNKGKSR